MKGRPFDFWGVRSLGNSAPKTSSTVSVSAVQTSKHSDTGPPDRVGLHFADAASLLPEMAGEGGLVKVVLLSFPKREPCIDYFPQLTFL
jgi:hypothetical protein